MKGQGPSNLLFSETVGSLETRFHMEANGSPETKIFSSEFGHMTEMAPHAIYGKKL